MTRSMSESPRRRPAHATVVAYVALFIALGSTAWALHANSVRSRHIVDHQVKTQDLGPNSVNSAKVANNSLSGADINESTLAGVLRFGGTIPSGTTVRGVFACHDANQQFNNPGPSLLEAHCFDGVSFPVRAPEPITNAKVNFAPGANGEDDPACTGSPSNPTAPPGKVCLYQSGGVGGGSSTLSGDEIFVTPSAFGFVVQANVTDQTNARVGTEGTWAYTAP